MWKQRKGLSFVLSTFQNLSVVKTAVSSMCRSPTGDDRYLVDSPSPITKIAEILLLWTLLSNLFPSELASKGWQRTAYCA